MNRLTYTSHAAFLRSVQVSGASLLLYIEGRDDTAFYDQVCSSLCGRAGVRFEIRRARELPGGTDGKPGLLNWYNYLRSRAKLLHQFSGKTIAALFFLDKDVDDFRTALKRSKHVVYTEYYDHEGYLFREGDILKAIAVAAAIEESKVKAWLGDGQQWRQKAAARWKDWVKLCLFARVRGVRGISNYRVTSQINLPLHGNVNSAKLAMHLGDLRSNCGLGPEQFERAFRHSSEKVEHAYSVDRAERVFKAKWYCTIAEAEVNHLATGYQINGKGLGQRIPGCLLLTLNFDNPWSEHFRGPLRALLSHI